MSQVRNGKAFEYALATAISRLTKVPVTENKAFETAKAYYKSLQNNRQSIDRGAYETAVFLQRHDVRLNETTAITLQDDFKGRDGDVRDIVNTTPAGEIGISAKHNHAAVKHSRLSDRIDFGKEWCDYPVGNRYWQRVKPIFEDLRQKKAQGLLFKDIPNKISITYLPILSAFEDELRRLCEDHGNRFILRLFQYLVGTKDFYKVIGKKTTVSVSSMNINGTLKWGKKWKIPNRIEQIMRKKESESTLLVTFEGGWQLSFRLHNASSKVEPSLKFDIQFIGLPQGVARHEIPLTTQ